jgi:hypothetical protein
MQPIWRWEVSGEFRGKPPLSIVRPHMPETGKIERANRILAY